MIEETYEQQIKDSDMIFTQISTSAIDNFIFDLKIFYGLISPRLIWIRITGLMWGVAIQKTPKTFSERNGYTWYLPLPRGWRFTILKATK